ncbi:porin family protein [Waterburya agarophytonicola K14]|uniref:Porin family protein n=1 Tax=Waterburya agarophytonicola KI4 TaxID=2874699 RepID=A0A964BRN6_9CYAN|nr:outer membrane beta-barrel protein [Waterburya agarophytonicola]MCC0177561.1 porin family protein [Waterburya agarophytonicola KI4]
MKIKTIILAVLLSWGIPLAAKAESQDNSDYQVSCQSQCDRFKLSQNNTFPQIADSYDGGQTPRGRSLRGNPSLTKRIYAGGTLGIFFVSELDGIEIIEQDLDIDAIDPNTGFGGSLFAGYRFSHILGADLEGYIFGGGAEPEDSNFSSAGLFVNPRFFLPLGSNSLKAPYLFASPGVGIVGIGFGEEIDDITEDPDTAFAFQLKAGAGLPISESFDVIGQIRYVNAQNIYREENGEDSNLSTVGLEVGLNFKI